MYSEYIYKKMNEGYNYIVCPRQTGKTTASIKYALDNNFKICIPADRWQQKYRGIDTFTQYAFERYKNDDNIIFDEFEIFNTEIQKKIIEAFFTHYHNWIFITTPRNNPLSLDKNNKILLEATNDIAFKVFMLKDKIKILKKLNNL